jgi:O-antigen/teichoic acid export membrane protein
MAYRKLLKSSVLVIVIANSANIFAYLFQFIMGRYLSVEDFGVLNSINSLGVIVGAIAGIIPYVVAKYIIEFKDDKELSSLLIWNIFKFTIFITFIISALVVTFINDIDNYLKLNDHIPIYIFLVSMISGFFLSIFFGVMQGLLMYVRSAIKGASSAALRFIFAIILVGFLGYGYNGALGATIFANILIAIWVYSVVNKHIKFYKPKGVSFPPGTYKRMFTYALPVALTWFSIGLLTNMDIVLVKHYTSAIEAGEYSVAALIGRIAVFLPSVLLAVLFPQVSQNSKDGKSSVGTVIVVMILTLILSCGFTLIIYLFPEFIITLLFGDKYIGGAEVLVIITFAMALVAILSVLFNFFLAKHIYSFLYFSWTILIGLGFVIIFYMNETSIQIATAILYGMIVLVIVNSIIMFYYYNKERIAIARAS